MTTDGPTSRGPPPLRLRRAPRSACKRLAAPRPKAPAGQASVVQERTGGRSCRGNSAGRRARSQQGGAGPAASGTGRKGRRAPRSARSRPCPGANPSPTTPTSRPAPHGHRSTGAREHGRMGARKDGRTGSRHSVAAARQTLVPAAQSPRARPARVLTVAWGPAHGAQVEVAVMEEKLVLRAWARPAQQGHEVASVDDPAGGTKRVASG